MEPDQTSNTRSRSIFLAVITSIASKFGMLLLRLISIPVAIRVLGLEEFGVYTAITIVVAMVDTFHVGIGPALTHRLSKAVTEGDREKQKRLVATAMTVSFVLTLFFGFILSWIIWQVPITTLFGEKFGPFAGTMKGACWLALGIISVEFMCILGERARDGYMETRISNLWGAAGNVCGALVLLFGIRHFPNLYFFILAVNGSMAAAKLGNLIHFFMRRPFLIHWFKNFRRDLVKPLLFSGGVFTITYSLSAIIEYSLVAYLVGRYLGPVAAATCGIFVTIHVSLTGLLQMFTIPMWPALIDARKRGDFDWIQKIATRLRLLSLAFGLAVVVGTALLGPWAIPLWIGEELVVGRLGMVAFALYFAVHIWRLAHQTLLLGFDQEKWVARTIILEATVVSVITWTLLDTGNGVASVYFGITIGLLLVSSWAFPFRFQKLPGAFANQVEQPTRDSLCDW